MVRPERLAAALGVLACCLSLCSSASAKSYLAEDESLTSDYAAIEGAMVGVVLPGGPESFIHVVQSSKSVLPSPSGPADGETDCYDASGDPIGPAVGCKVVIAKVAHTNGELRDTVAHEVFHVFQVVMSGTIANFYSEPRKDWLIEGSASWVESDLIKGDKGASAEWAHYLRSPGQPLFSRSYDAIGFFGHMAQVGISPWKRFKAMFAATSSLAAYEAAIGTSINFLDSEASVFFREALFGSAWNAQGPNVPGKTAVGFKPAAVKITKGTPPTTLSVKPFADGAYELTIGGLPSSESVVEVKVDAGYVRLRSTHGGHVDAVDPKQVLLCTDPKGCKCPSHPNDYEQFRTGDLALTAGKLEGKVELIRRRPCEVLVSSVPCNVILPGFSTEVSTAVEPVVGAPLSATVTSPGGSTDSTCAFLVKGAATGPEDSFVGVVAPIISVLRATSAPGAAKYYEISTKVPAPGYAIAHPDIGTEAELLTKSEIGSSGQTEYSSLAFVRVSNVVVDYNLYSTGGNSEASPAESLRLLTEVAREL
jgi:hypothetical protein